jgi:hypothetical protein
MMTPDEAFDAAEDMVLDVRDALDAAEREGRKLTFSEMEELAMTLRVSAELAIASSAPAATETRQ